MPKPIKKKFARQEAKAEDSVRSYMAQTAEALEARRKQIGIAALAVLVAVIAVAGFVMQQRSQERRAREAFHAGYKHYHALYETKMLPRPHRLEKALASFRSSYELGGSPEALMYVANSQYALGRYEESLASLEKLTKTFPEDDIYVPLALYKSAMIELKLDDPEGALGYLDGLYAAKGDSYKDLALAEAASILESLGREEEAKEKYRTLLELYPDSSFAEEARFKTGDGEPQEAEEAESRTGAGETPGLGDQPGEAEAGD